MRVLLWRVLFTLAGVASFIVVPIAVATAWLAKQIYRLRDRAEIELLHAHPFTRRRLRAQRDGAPR